jgi:hypothetical protein
MAEPTLGPWTFDEDDIRVIMAGDIVIAEVPDTGEGYEGDDPIAKANAYLLAASWELLSACRMFVAWDENAHSTEAEADTLRHAMAAAIAKATAEE